MKTQLLCTFTKRNRLYDTVSLIIECHEIVFNKIYVFTNEDDHHQLICTYNIPQNEDNYIMSKDARQKLRRRKRKALRMSRLGFTDRLRKDKDYEKESDEEEESRSRIQLVQ